MLHTHWGRAVLLCGLVLAVGCAEDDAKEGPEEAPDGGNDGGGGTDGGSGADDGTDGGSDEGSDDSGGPVPGGVVEAVQAPCSGGEEGTPSTVPAVLLDSTVTWTLEFDEEAEALGWIDCAYTREFSGVQRLDIPHLCPTCTVIAEGEARMTAGFEDCYEPLFGGEADRTETWGISEAGLHRTGASQAPLLDPLATFTPPAAEGEPVELAWEAEYALTDGGNVVLAAAGTMAWAPDPATELTEYLGPRTAPYACGWECNDPGDLVGVDPMAPGETIPPGRFEDQCGDMVDLYDFYGSYLIIDSSQSDCGPCRAMADEAERFKEEMVDQDIPVRMVTLLGNGLADPFGSPPEEVLQGWVSAYGLTDPVLYDRGWTYVYFSRYMPEYLDDSLGFPAWMIVDPDMNVLFANVGFSTWDTAKDVIEADWAARAGD